MNNSPLCLSIELLPPGQGWLAVGLGSSLLRRLAIWRDQNGLMGSWVVVMIPRVVFFSVRFLRKPNWASGLFELLDSLPVP